MRKMRGNEAILKNFKGKWMGKDTGKKNKPKGSDHEGPCPVG